MGIEFRCPNCNKLLRTPEGTQGKQAKCPQCGGVTTIPATSTEAMPPRDPNFATATAPVPTPEASPPAADNPYQSAYQAPPTTAAAAGPGAFQPTQIDFSDIFNNTWEIYKNNLGMCIVGPLLSNFCSYVIAMIGNALLMAGIENADPPVAAILGSILGLFLLVVTAFFYLGLIKYMLDIARGAPPRIGDLFGAGPLLVPGSIVFLLLSVGMMAGMCLLVVPGVIFGLFFWLAPYLLVDRQTSVMDSFRMSASAMAGNKLTTFLLFLVTMLVVLMLAIVTCGIAGIFTGPFMMLMAAVIYLRATGQRTAAEPTYPGAERGFGTPGAQPSF